MHGAICLHLQKPAGSRDDPVTPVSGRFGGGIPESNDTAPPEGGEGGVVGRAGAPAGHSLPLGTEDGWPGLSAS